MVLLMEQISEDDPCVCVCFGGKVAGVKNVHFKVHQVGRAYRIFRYLSEQLKSWP